MKTEDLKLAIEIISTIEFLEEFLESLKKGCNSIGFIGEPMRLTSYHKFSYELNNQQHNTHKSKTLAPITNKIVEHTIHIVADALLSCKKELENI
jgi:hypothetical protein